MALSQYDNNSTGAALGMVSSRNLTSSTIGDVAGVITQEFYNDANAAIVGLSIQTTAEGVGAGAEDAETVFSSMVGGSLATRMSFTTGGIVTFPVKVRLDHATDAVLVVRDGTTERFEVYGQTAGRIKVLASQELRITDSSDDSFMVFDEANARVGIGSTLSPASGTLQIKDASSGGKTEIYINANSLQDDTPLMRFHRGDGTETGSIGSMSKPVFVGTSVGTAEPPIMVMSGHFGGDTSIVTTGTGGAGGLVSLTGSDGGVAALAATASKGGAGGALLFTGGSGAAASPIGSGTNIGGAGGDITLTPGAGGSATGGAVNTDGRDGMVIIAQPTTAATDFFQVKSSGGTVRARIDSLGHFSVGDYSPTSTELFVADGVDQRFVVGTGESQGVKLHGYAVSSSPALLILAGSRNFAANANNDTVGRVQVTAYNSAAAEVIASQLDTKVISNTAGDEDFESSWDVMHAGVIATKLRVESNRNVLVKDWEATNGVTTLVVQAGAGQSTTNLMEVQNAASSKLLEITSIGSILTSANAWVGVKTSTSLITENSNEITLRADQHVNILIDSLNLSGAYEFRVGRADTLASGSPVWMLRLGVDGYLIGAAVDAAIADGDLNASEFTTYLDESGNLLVFKVKYAGGTVKTGSVSLT